MGSRPQWLDYDPVEFLARLDWAPMLGILNKKGSHSIFLDQRKKGGLMAGQFISRGFGGKRRQLEAANRAPPGQYITPDFPVLSAGPTPSISPATWRFTIEGLVTAPVGWSWDEFQQLPRQEFTVDIHCVTKWSKLDTRWGVSVCIGCSIRWAWIRRRSTSRPSATAAIRPICRWERSSMGRRSSPTATAAGHSPPSTAGHSFSSRYSSLVEGYELRGGQMKAARSLTGKDSTQGADG